MSKRKILIATTNQGKFEEFTTELADLNFDFINLKDLGLDRIDLEEPFGTVWENARHKAKFFAKKSKLLTVADDTGFFIKALKGGPGVRAKRYASTGLERTQKVLENMKDKKDRRAYFTTTICVYDPKTDNFNIINGKTNGLITKKMIGQTRQGVEYDSAFYYEPLNKTYAQMSLLEKNLVSHRGKAVIKLKYFLDKQYSLRKIVASGAVIIKDRKMLMTKRRDTRPRFNNRWEFPGGCVDENENVISTMKREVLEETGYVVEPVEMIPVVMAQTEKKDNYQVFLIFHISKIKSGKFKPADNEVADGAWVTYSEALKKLLLPMNKEFIKQNKKLFKKYID